MVKRSHEERNFYDTYFHHVNSDWLPLLAIVPPPTHFPDTLWQKLIRFWRLEIHQLVISSRRVCNLPKMHLAALKSLYKWGTSTNHLNKLKCREFSPVVAAHGDWSIFTKLHTQVKKAPTYREVHPFSNSPAALTCNKKKIRNTLTK